MEENSKQLLMSYLRKEIHAYRDQEGFSQEMMAEKLHISPRSYFDQEHGKYGFSALSLIYFLLLLPEDEVIIFLKNFREVLQRSGEDAA